MRFVKLNLTTYLMARQKKHMNIYGNSMTKGSFCRNLSYIWRLKKIRYFDFHKYILLEDQSVIEEPDYKVILISLITSVKYELK